MGCIVSLNRQRQASTLLYPFANQAESIDLWSHNQKSGRIDVLLMQLHLFDNEVCSTYDLDVLEVHDRFIYLLARCVSSNRLQRNKNVYVRIAFSERDASRAKVNVVFRTNKDHESHWLCCLTPLLTTRNDGHLEDIDEPDTLCLAIKKGL